jgi:hypothetical protein
MIVFLQKLIGKVVAKFFLGHYAFSKFYLYEMDIKECILASFKVQEDDVKTREALWVNICYGVHTKITI